MGREVIKIREGSGGEGQLEWKLAFGCIFFFFFFFFPLQYMDGLVLFTWVRGVQSPVHHSTPSQSYESSHSTSGIIYIMS